MKKLLVILAAAVCISCQPSADKATAQQPQIESMFDDGNYAMFIHFGLYSKLEGIWKGKTYYGAAEWIMNHNQAGIPYDEYMAEASTFNPSEFDAEAVAQLAEDAGMKYIVITSKHHEGFAMFDTAVSDFDIVDATPLKRDIMGELAEACHRHGLGIGFYYSQFQDWTAPGGGNGPKTDKDGREVSFDEYFYSKCVPQVNEITTKYGDIAIIWFDTPGNMDISYSKYLVDLVHKNQPGALVSSRVGNGMGDYETLGDMEVPLTNHPGRWEGIDVTQVGWGYSKLDNQWKTPEYIVRNLVSTVARGGTFMLNVGPEANGQIHEMAASSLRKSGEWVKKYPQAVYCAGPSPWGHAFPWGDAVTQGTDRIELVVYDWPSDGRLWVPGLKSDIKSAKLAGGKKLKLSRDGDWVCINVPFERPDAIASVIELTLRGEVEADGTLAAVPSMTSTFPTELAELQGCKLNRGAWMENFGEWKFKKHARELTEDSRVIWTVNIKEPGYYNVGLEYKGEGRIEWVMELDGGVEEVRMNQGASTAFAWHSLGWIKVSEPGIHTFSIRANDGDYQNARLSGMSLTQINI